MPSGCCTAVKPIGGFLELELPAGSGNYHSTPLTYKSGRAAFKAILKHLHPRRVYVPFYCCDALLQPLREDGIRYEFYPITPSLEPVFLPDLVEGELFVCVNYFDLKRDCIGRLSAHYRDRLVVDATQSFYTKGDGISWSFNSCRKFFGVPDGSYLYVPEIRATDFRPLKQENSRYLTEHLIRRREGDLKGGYAASQQNEALMDTGPAAMSLFTRRLLGQVDYAAAAAARRCNFQQLQLRLGKLNRLAPVLDAEAVPHYFPLLPSKPIGRNRLWAEQIFVPTLWEDCLNRTEPGFEFERELSSTLLPLPVDQRYTPIDMDRVADVVLGCYAAL